MSPEQSVHELRREMYKEFAEGFEKELKSISLAQTDPGFQGVAGEAAFRAWLKDQLPSRIDPLSGAIVTQKSDPSHQRDCVLFDRVDCAVFRTIGSQADLLPIEGVVGAIEVNTGGSGATRQKILKDAAKLSELGTLFRDERVALLPKLERLGPAPHVGATLTNEIFVRRQTFSLPPLLLLFAESIEGSLLDYAEALAEHNEQTSVGASVDGLFILDQGFALHQNEEGWAHHRIAGLSFAARPAPGWEVLLKLVSTVWSHLWKGPYGVPNLRGYYTDQSYFTDVEYPECSVVSSESYVTQAAEGMATTHAL